MLAGIVLIHFLCHFRMLAGMWYFFALIMIASYTANLVRTCQNVRDLESVVQILL
jgi:hypothetical protein